MNHPSRNQSPPAPPPLPPVFFRPWAEKTPTEDGAKVHFISPEVSLLPDEHDRSSLEQLKRLRPHIPSIRAKFSQVIYKPTRNWNPCVCDICGASFTQRFNLSAHINNVHYKIKESNLDKCLRNVQRLRRYVYVSRNNPLYKLECELCGMRVRHRGVLRKHMKDWHEDRIPLPLDLSQM
jgi:hypothetical protein